MQLTYTPLLINRLLPEGKELFKDVLEKHPHAVILDFYRNQREELIKTRNPQKQFTPKALNEAYDLWAQNLNVDLEGIWVWYPWLGKMVHLLAKEEFIELRTSRNQHKITALEQHNLMQKRIGIIGLSVGHAVALSLATERVCGFLRLADFDTIDLSNLNRIRTGVVNLGLNKCIVTAREIAEIDPFIEVECFTEGLNDANLNPFLSDGGNLDLLIDECDGLDIKIKSRIAARKLGIPVMMETSDRGMLDVERYDLEPNRPILHGMAEQLNPDTLNNLTTEQKIPIVLKLTDALRGSLRGRVSLIEIGQSIGTWPQLASAVALGGAVVTDTARRLLLGQYHESGRYYVDIESIVSNKNRELSEQEGSNAPASIESFNLQQAITIARQFSPLQEAILPTADQINQIVSAACLAPSTGNDQPWKWVFQNKQLFLFHDEARSDSFGDYRYIASDITFGACAENVILKANELGLKTAFRSFPLGEASKLIAVFNFFPYHYTEDDEVVNNPELVKQITKRITNRNQTKTEVLESALVNELSDSIKNIDGAKHYFFTDTATKRGIGKIIGACDRIRLLNIQGHRDFVQREMRWTPEQAESTKDGIDIRTLGLSNAQLSALMLVKDPAVANTLHNINGGKALIEATLQTVLPSAGIGIITVAGGYQRNKYFEGGRAMERLWLKATELNLAVHPLISPFYLFPRAIFGHGEGLDKQENDELLALRKTFIELTGIGGNSAEVFLYKIGRAEPPLITTLRLPLTETLFWEE